MEPALNGTIWRTDRIHSFSSAGAEHREDTENLGMKAERVEDDDTLGTLSKKKRKKKNSLMQTRKRNMVLITSKLVRADVMWFGHSPHSNCDCSDMKE